MFYHLCTNPVTVQAKAFFVLVGGDYQQPILCLVGNLSNSSSSHDKAAGQQLTWREFRTLLHEMGHAVHSMVSRTRYQHVWGTR